MVKLQKPELHIGYRLQILSTRIVLHFMGLCAWLCLQKFSTFYAFCY